MSGDNTASSVTLANCDAEPIHIPGNVQGHGVLLACGVTDWQITHVSANVSNLLGKPAASVLGTTVASLLGTKLLADLQPAAPADPAGPRIPARAFGVRLKSGPGRYNVTLHEHGGRRILELEPTDGASSTAPMDIVRTILSRLQQARTLHDLCSETAAQIKDLIGFDRVMIYRFLGDGSGQVVAEAREPDLEPLLNLRYPATDIPQQARELYKKNWVRLISDVAATPVPIFAAPEEAARPLDLSFADLRSVSPIHIEYLRNMGVGASMSISVVVGGELWGLIACHSRGPAVVCANVRSATELLGQVFSLQIQTVEGIEAYVTMRAARALLDRIVAEFPVDGDLLDNLSARLDQLAAFIPCASVGVLVDHSWNAIGAAPFASEARALAEFLDSQQCAGIWASEQLGKAFRPAHTWRCGMKGLLAIPLSREAGDWLLFFRGEYAQSIEWGGDPNKAVNPDSATGRISPRKSFATWREEVHGQSQPWTSREKLIADTLRIYLLDIILRFREVIIEERRQAQQRQRLMVSELNHRVKGTLELVQSLLLHGYDEPAAVQKFVRTLEGRIKAISLAHDAVTQPSGAELRVLVERAIAMQLAKMAKIDIDGRQTCLEPKAYTVMALVLHELASNSASTGALSSSTGSLTVTWVVDAAGRLILFWEETRSEFSPAISRDALSAIIVNRNIPHELGGEARIDHDEHSIRATFVIPARFVVRSEADDNDGRRSLSAHTPTRRQLEGYAILVVEDQTPAALELERQLYERGAASVTIAGTADAALDALRDDAADVAVLDIDLGHETSFAVADDLAKRSIPFIFAGSEADAALVPHHHRDAQRVPKPYAGDAIAERLREALLPHLIRAVLTRLV